MKILITGATGFVGRAILYSLVEGGHQLVASTRTPSKDLEKIAKCVLVGDLSADTDWSLALDGIDVVVHAASRVPVAKEKEEDALSGFRKTNVLGALNLARQAAQSGVRRFVFISSIKAMGEESFDNPFSADDICNPTTPYGISKYEAEHALKEIGQETGMEIAIIRPPLVYGVGAKGNLRTLQKLISFGLPLPFGSLHNKRSMVSIDNLVDFIRLCIEHPNAANQTFLVADGVDLSTPQMIKKIGKLIEKSVVVMPFPQLLLELILQIIGGKELARRICGSLQIDIDKNKQVLGWIPKVNFPSLR